MPTSTDTSDGLRIVFAGTPEFAVPALEHVAASRHDLVGVITNPDRARGRGSEPQPPPVKVAAQSRDVPVHQPESVGSEDSMARIRAFEPDVLVVAAYGQILPEELLELPTRDCINIHASLLPKYRGAAPINWAIVEGEEETGISIMEMEPDLDTGPVLMDESVEIGPLETAEQLHDRLAALGADLIVDALDALDAGEVEKTPQDDSKATYAPKLSKSDGAIDWTDSGESIARRIRGFHPWPGTFSFHHRDGDRTRISFQLARAADIAASDAAPGDVLEADASEGRLTIAAGEGAVEILKLQAAGRRAMEVDDFLNGHTIEPGDRFASDEE